MKRVSSPLKAIHQQCFDCIYDENSPGTRHQQTEGCTSPSCALYEFRPVTDKTKKERKEAKFNAMTPEQQEKALKKSQEARERFGWSE